MFHKKVKNLGNTDFHENSLSDTVFYALSNDVKIMVVGRLEKKLCVSKVAPQKVLFSAFFRRKINIKKNYGFNR